MKRIIILLEILLVSILVIACATPTEEFDRLEWVKSASRLVFSASYHKPKSTYEGQELGDFLAKFELYEDEHQPSMLIYYSKGTIEIEGKKYPVYIYLEKVAHAKVVFVVQKGKEEIRLIAKE